MKFLASRHSRRAVLRRVGAAAALAPLVPLFGDEALAAPNKRLLLVYHPNGGTYRVWRPTSSTNGLQMGPTLTPLQAHAKDLTLVGGLTLQSGYGGSLHSFGMGACWTGANLVDGGGGKRIPTVFADGPSVDQIIAQKSTLAKGTRFPTLEIGVRCSKGKYAGTPAAFMIYTGPNKPVRSQDDPYTLFDRLFAGVTGGGAATTSTERAPDAIRARRRSVIDYVRKELATVSGQVAAADRVKIESHLEGIRNLEKRLDGTTPVAAATCAPPKKDGRGLDPWANDNVPAMIPIMTDITVNALACGLTNIASLMWLDGYGTNTVFRWLGENREYHDVQHKGFESPGKAMLQKWFAERFAELLVAMKKVPEGSGTLLDNTVVLWGSDMATGDHTRENTMYVIAGGGNQYFKLGRFVENQKEKHGRLLVSLMHAFGLTSEMTIGGPTDAGSGPLGGLT
jgi:hypothetical protein